MRCRVSLVGVIVGCALCGYDLDAGLLTLQRRVMAREGRHGSGALRARLIAAVVAIMIVRAAPTVSGYTCRGNGVSAYFHDDERGLMQNTKWVVRIDGSGRGNKAMSLLEVYVRDRNNSIKRPRYGWQRYIFDKNDANRCRDDNLGTHCTTPFTSNSDNFMDFFYSSLSVDNLEKVVLENNYDFHKGASDVRQVVEITKTCRTR